MHGIFVVSIHSELLVQIGSVNRITVITVYIFNFSGHIT